MRLTFILIALNISVFMLQLAAFFMTSQPLVDAYFALTPDDALGGRYWQFLTYMFLHAAVDDSGGVILGHIFINMLVLLIFGPLVESRIGWVWFLSVYLASGVFSAFFHIAFTGISDIQLVGASGAVFSIMAIYGLLYPKEWIWMMPGIPMPAILSVFVFAGMQIFFGFFGGQPNVAYFGHLGGIIAGAAFAIYWKYVRRAKPRRAGNWEPTD